MEKAVNSTITVSKQLGYKNNYGEEQIEEEPLTVHQFVTANAEVEVGVAMTINLGNFESAKLSVSLRLPCYAEEIDNAYTYAQAFVEERIAKERDQIKAWKTGKTASPL